MDSKDRRQAIMLLKYLGLGESPARRFLKKFGRMPMDALILFLPRDPEPVDEIVIIRGGGTHA